MNNHWGSRVLLALALVLFAASIAVADGPEAQTQSDAVAQVRFDQNLGAQIPLDATFVDDTGREVQLSEYFGQRPVVFLLSYYRCPNLCGLVYNGFVESVQQIDFTIGKDFDVVALSIDPTEDAAAAAAKKAELVAKYNRAGSAAGWHFLTGTEEQIRRVTDTAGFSYVYNEEQDQYAHPAGIVIVTPEGKVTRYLYGLSFPANDLRLGLLEGSENKIGSPVDQILLRCFHYDPQAGKYTLAIMNIIRFFGTITALSLAILMFVLFKRHNPTGGMTA